MNAKGTAAALPPREAARSLMHEEEAHTIYEDRLLCSLVHGCFARRGICRGSGGGEGAMRGPFCLSFNFRDPPLIDSPSYDIRYLRAPSFFPPSMKACRWRICQEGARPTRYNLPISLAMRVSATFRSSHRDSFGRGSPLRTVSSLHSC